MGLISALGLTITPGLARQRALGAWEDIRATVCKAIRLVSFLMAPAMAVLTVIGPDLGKALYRNESVGRFMLPLAVGTMLNCWGAIFSGALNGLGLQRKVARTAILCDVIQLTLTILTVPRFGLRGFVVGFVLSSAVSVGLDLRELCRSAEMKPKWKEWLFAPVTAAVLSGMWGNLLFRYLTDNGIGHGHACVGVTALEIVLYIAALQAQGVCLKKRSAAG
jgi:stage V sporulation protein B